MILIMVGTSKIAPYEPYFLVFTALCSYLLHYTKIGLCDQ